MDESFIVVQTHSHPSSLIHSPLPPREGLWLFFLINLFVALIATHLADSILQHCVLLIEVVDWLLAHGIVVLWTLQEEAEEALCAKASCTCCKVAEQAEVETQWSSEDRVAAKEVNLYLHWIAHPSEDVDVIPSFLIVVAWWVIVDTHLVIILCILVVAMSVEIRLVFWFEDSLQCRELAHLLCTEVCWFVEHQTIAVAKDIC